jgi:integrase
LQKGKPVPAGPARGTTSRTLGGFVDMMLTTHWARQTDSRASAQHARIFKRMIGPSVPVAEALTQGSIDEWFADMIEERSPSGSTVNRYASMVSVLVNKAYALGMIDRKPTLPREREGEARLRWFDDHEEAELVSLLTEWGKPRWADFLVVLIDTGARTWKELGRLQWRDFVRSDPRRKVVASVTFWETKNGLSRVIPLTKRAEEIVERQRVYNEDGPFTSLSRGDGRRLYQRIRSVLPKYEDTTWYTARHTFASRLVQRGAPLYEVQKLMGHKSIEQTQRYAKLRPDNLARAVALLDGTPAVEPTANLSPEVLALAARIAAQMVAEGRVR